MDTEVLGAANQSHGLSAMFQRAARGQRLEIECSALESSEYSQTHYRLNDQGRSNFALTGATTFRIDCHYKVEV